MTRRLNRLLASTISLMLIVSLAVPAQMSQEKVDLDVVNKIKAEGLERSQVMDTLSSLCDVVGPRLTGSPGMKMANEWTKNKLAEWGLQNAHLEAWGPFGRGWSVERCAVHQLDPTPMPLIAFPKAWTPGTNGTITGEVVWTDIKTEADFEKYRGKLKGAIVLTAPTREVKAHFKPQGERLSDEDLLKLANAESSGGAMGGRNYSEDMLRQYRQVMELNRKKEEFFRNEGVAVLMDSGRAGDGGTIFVQSGGPRDAKAPQALPSVVLAVEHYNRLVRMIQKGAKVRLEVNVAAKFHDEDQMAYNTVAEIPGTDKKDEIVMLGGHMDSWHAGTGATDNAAGVAVTMEAVRILKALGLQPRRTIRIALWSGEEQGLLGSRAYVSDHFASRPAPPPSAANDPIAMMRGMNSGPLTLKPEHAKFSAYYNLDNGTGKIRGIYLQGNDAVRNIFRAWLSPFKDMGASTVTISNTGGTDHQAFDGVGLPGFQFIQDEIEYETRTHHSNMDVYDRIQADDMKQAAIIMASFVWHTAQREEKLPRKPMPQTGAAGGGQQ
jgi:hypothetical protein